MKSSSTSARIIQTTDSTGMLRDGSSRSRRLASNRHGDVYMLRAGEKGPETRTGILEVEGEGPVAGFKLDLRPIWAGL